MKITLLGHLHGYGGAEKSLVFLANQLVERGHDITLLSFTSDRNVYSLRDEVNYIFIPDKGSNKAAVLLNRFFCLRRELKQIKPDLAISFWFQLAVFGMMISKELGFKIIYSERGDPSDSEYDGLNGMIRRLSFPFMDGFVFQTKGAQAYFGEKIKDKSCVIHNAITVPDSIIEFKPVKKKNIVSVGRLHRQKNFPLLINAFSEIIKIHPEYKLVIYGEGEQRQELELLVERLGLVNNVALYGNSKDILIKMKEAEFFVLSSDFEGMPNVLMEAMGLGLPCVSTDCTPGGAAELIDNYTNGILVPKGNKAELVKAMLYTIEHFCRAEQMGRNATKILETHSPAKIYDMWETFIGGVVNGFNQSIL